MKMLFTFANVYTGGKFSRDESGVTMLEYSILLGVITVAAIVAIVFAGDWVATQWNNLKTTLPA